MDEDQKEVIIALEKLDQMLQLFYLSLPHGEAEKAGWTIKGMQFHTFFEEIFKTIKENFKRNPESMYPYMVMIRDCLDFVLDDSPFWPDQDDRDNSQAILNYLQQKRYTTFPNKNPVNLIEEDGRIKGVINDAYFSMSKKK